MELLDWAGEFRGGMSTHNDKPIQRESRRNAMEEPLGKNAKKATCVWPTIIALGNRDGLL
jgi:hypothetical protein